MIRAEQQQPLPSAPGYGRSSIAELLPSAAAALGADGFENPLDLPSAQRVCVVMVDGLGKSLLKQRSGHAPFLRRAMETARTLTSAFPSTTAASLGSLGTGLPPGQHGMVGYDVLDPGQDKIVNLLGGWDPGVDPGAWQPHPTIFERLAGQLPVATVSLPKFADSGMTRAALRGGSFHPASTSHARTTMTAELLGSHPRMLLYLYFNELDKAGHRHGCQSAQWGTALEEIDAAVKRLSRQLPSDTLLLVTGDHGMIDIEPAQRYDYSANPELIEGVRLTAGEPRMVHLYLQHGFAAGDRERLMASWQAAHGHHAWVLSRDDAESAGLFGTITDTVRPRIGDVLIAAREPVAFFDTRRIKPAALQMVGQHGSLTRAEREVPLLSVDIAGPASGGRKAQDVAAKGARRTTATGKGVACG